MSSSRGEGEPAVTSGMGSGKDSTKRSSTTSRSWSDHASSKWFVDWCCGDASHPVQQPCGPVIFVEANKRRRVLGAVLRWENAKGSRRRFYMKNVYGSKGNVAAGAKGAVLDMCMFEGFGAGAVNTPFYNDLQRQGGFVLGREFFDLLEDKDIALDVPCEVGLDLELSMPLQLCGGCESSGAAGEGGDLGSGEATHVQHKDTRGQFDDSEDEATPRLPFSASRERERSVLSILEVRLQTPVRQEVATDPGQEEVQCGSDLEPGEGHGADDKAVGGEGAQGTPQKRRGDCQEDLPASEPSTTRPTIDVDAGYFLEYKDGVRTRREFEISPAQIVDLGEWEDLYNQRSLDPVLVGTIKDAMQYAFENKEQRYELPIFKLAPLGLQKPTPRTEAQRLKPEEWKDELAGEYHYYTVCGQHNAAAARSLLGSEVAKNYNFERWPARMLYFPNDDFEGLKSREVALAEDIVHIKWKDTGDVTSIAPFANDPLEADMRGAELKEAVAATKSHTFVLDLCEPVDLKLWKAQAWETLDSYLQTWCPSHWTLVVFVPRQHNLTFLASMHHLSFVKLLEGKWVRRVHQKKSFPVGNNLYREEDRMYILFKGDDLRANTSVVYKGNLPRGAAAAVRLPQRVTQTDVSEIPFVPCYWSLVAPERQGSVYGDMERNPTQFVGLLDFLGKKGESVVFLGKPHARSVWHLLKAGRHVVAMEGNAELLQFTMLVVKSEVNSGGHNCEFMVVKPTRDKKVPPPSGPDAGEPSKDPEIGSVAAPDGNVGKVSPEQGRRPQVLQHEAAGTGYGDTHTTKSAEIRTSSGGGCRPGIVVLLRGAACTETEGRSSGFNTGTAEGDEFRGREVGEKMEERRGAQEGEEEGEEEGKEEGEEEEEGEEAGETEVLELLEGREGAGSRDDEVEHSEDDAGSGESYDEFGQLYGEHHEDDVDIDATAIEMETQVVSSLSAQPEDYAVWPLTSVVDLQHRFDEASVAISPSKTSRRISIDEVIDGILGEHNVSARPSTTPDVDETRNVTSLVAAALTSSPPKSLVLPATLAAGEKGEVGGRQHVKSPKKSKVGGQALDVLALPAPNSPSKERRDKQTGVADW
ncbi:hypothetical protein CBR_g56039 [Chara braunii]|uniref:Uncharacterized protein n=1 Tax=Chara braunii TaxID=69332 RepID=A0A388MDC2_CHABU|nr:hypothetical protein CBR_g56039 [Chara braunii]|eukprot:GBG92566.1 hypothetical protein CBR_g56039 [Chara braunii]